MWQQLDTPRSRIQLVASLRHRFPNLSEGDAERDVNAFLAELEQHAMLA